MNVLEYQSTLIVMVEALVILSILLIGEEFGWLGAEALLPRRDKTKPTNHGQPMGI